MSENENIEQPTEAEVEAPVSEEPPIPDALREVDPAKLAEIRKKMQEFLAKQGTTISGSEDPDAPPIHLGGTEGDKIEADTSVGANVDWSEYDLQYSVRHLYPRANVRETAQGLKWVAMLDEFFSIERAANKHGQMVKIPGSIDKTEVEPLNLGEYLTQVVNGPEGWTIASILPGSMGNAVVILRKQSPYVLPDPVPLKKMEEVEAPTDPELTAVENAALDFANEEGLTPPPVEEETGVEEPVVPAGAVTLRPVPASEVELEEGTGALPARDTDLIRRAIDRNRPITDAATAPSGIQPPALDPSRGVQGEKFDGAPGIENIREGMRKILPELEG